MCPMHPEIRKTTLTWARLGGTNAAIGTQEARRLSVNAANPPGNSRSRMRLVYGRARPGALAILQEDRMVALDRIKYEASAIGLDIDWGAADRHATLHFLSS